MTDNESPIGDSGDAHVQVVPDWLTATRADFDFVDINRPADGSDALDCSDLSQLYQAAASESKSAGLTADYRVYAMIAALCSFYAKPDEPNEPFGPLFTFPDGRRSATPMDFRGSAEKALIGTAPVFRNPALRARVSDMLWLLDKSRADTARAAIESYLDVIESAQSSKGKLRPAREGADFYLCIELLRRALHIARAIGWDTEHALKARAVLRALRNQASERTIPSDFMWVAELDLDLDGSEPALLATQAETLLPLVDDLHHQHRLWHIAARGHAYAEAIDDKHRCQLSAAECLVRVGDAGAKSAMYQSHWLERAIQELYRVPGTKERRRELKHRLIDVQSRVPDEFSSFSHETDISEIAALARKVVEGKSLMIAIGLLSRIGFSPAPEKLRDHAVESIKAHPLSALFMSTRVDKDGKPVHRSPGGSEDSEAAIQQQIAQAESIRRGLMVRGQIEPIRQLIMSQYQITDGDFDSICHHSPFVPPGHEQIFAKGFARFFQGDMASAVHILALQLENALRYVLRSAGHDVVKMNGDMTQEDLDLSALLRLRAPMEEIFGPALTADIDNVFNYRGGPSVRHSVAHGKFTLSEAFGDDAAYACWLVLHLTCMPLLAEWSKLTSLEAASLSSIST